MTLFAIIAAALKKAWASFYESRNGPHWRYTRKRALIRDGHKCINCKSKKRLCGHHINGWAWFPLERFLVSNVATLCWTCHLAYHIWNGGHRIKCTAESFEKWLKIQRRLKRKGNKEGDWLTNIFLLMLLVGLVIFGLKFQ